MSEAFAGLGISFFRRDYPSANTALLHGPCPVLVDTGFGSDAPELVARLRACGVGPEALALIVNTHFHSDHVGGNHHVQSRWRTEIAAQADEAAARMHAPCRRVRSRSFPTPVSTGSGSKGLSQPRRIRHGTPASRRI